MKFMRKALGMKPSDPNHVVQTLKVGNNGINFHSIPSKIRNRCDDAVIAAIGQTLRSVYSEVDKTSLKKKTWGERAVIINALVLASSVSSGIVLVKNGSLEIGIFLLVIAVISTIIFMVLPMAISYYEKQWKRQNLNVLKSKLPGLNSKLNGLQIIARSGVIVDENIKLEYDISPSLADNCKVTLSFDASNNVYDEKEALTMENVQNGTQDRENAVGAQGVQYVVVEQNGQQFVLVPANNVNNVNARMGNINMNIGSGRGNEGRREGEKVPNEFGSDATNVVDAINIVTSR